MMRPGDAIGPYRIERRLGGGGMGVVYLARAPDGREVAVKVASAGASAAAALRREAAIVQQVSHPSIVRAVGVGDDPGPWFAMELVIGRPLSGLDGDVGTFAGTLDLGGDVDEPIGDAASPRSSSAERAGGSGPRLAALARVCRALSFLHGAGVVHADLKPDNVIIREDGTVVLVDFGLARRFNTPASREILDPRTRAGTPPYMAPELVRGDAIDARTDLYALGCMLYEAVTGVVPFSHTRLDRLLEAHLYERPVPPDAVADVHPELAAVILRLLEKDPAERIGQAEVVRGALVAAGHGEADDPAPAGLPCLYRPSVVGRGAVLAALHAAVDERGLTVLRGDAGSGRTRVLAAVGEAHREHRVFSVACGAGPGDLDALEVTLGTGHGGTSAERAARVVDQIRALGGRALVLVDDAGLADTAAKRLLVELAAATDVATIATAGPGDALSGARELSLPPLDAVAVRDLASQMLGLHRVPPMFASSLLARAGGNPLAVAELVRAAVGAGALAIDTRGQFVVDDAASVGDLPTPASWSDSVATRLGGLRGDERAVVEVAAVLGASFPVRDLEALCDVDPTAAIGSLLAHQILEDVAGARLRWASEVLRDALLATLPADRRRALHLAASRVASDRDGRAWHLSRAGEVDLAFGALRAAAQAALARQDALRAAELLREALALGGGAERHAALLDLASAYVQVGEFEAMYTAAIEAAGAADPAVRSMALIRAGRASVSLGELARAERCFTEARAVAQGAGRGGDELDATIWLSVVARRTQRFSDAQAWLDRAWALAPDASEAWICAGELAYALGRFDEGVAAIERGLQTSQVSGVSARVNLALCHRGAGRLADALRAFEAAEAEARATGRVAMLTVIDLHRGLIAMDQGAVADACPRLEAAVAAARRFGDRQVEGVGLANLGEAQRQLGRRAEARATLRRALELVRRTKSRAFEAWILTVLAHVAADGGQLDAGIAQAQEALALQREIADVPEQARTLSLLASMARRRGDVEASVTWAREAGALATNAEVVVRVAVNAELGHAALATGGDPTPYLSEARALAGGEGSETRGWVAELEAAIARAAGRHLC